MRPGTDQCVIQDPPTPAALDGSILGQPSEMVSDENQKEQIETKQKIPFQAENNWDRQTTKPRSDLTEKRESNVADFFKGKSSG